MIACAVSNWIRGARVERGAGDGGRGAGYG